jgi:hypothetical protein
MRYAVAARAIFTVRNVGEENSRRKPTKKWGRAADTRGRQNRFVCAQGTLPRQIDIIVNF